MLSTFGATKSSSMFRKQRSQGQKSYHLRQFDLPIHWKLSHFPKPLPCWCSSWMNSYTNLSFASDARSTMGNVSSVYFSLCLPAYLPVYLLLINLFNSLSLLHLQYLLYLSTVPIYSIYSWHPCTVAIYLSICLSHPISSSTSLSFALSTTSKASTIHNMHTIDIILYTYHAHHTCLSTGCIPVPLTKHSADHEKPYPELYFYSYII